MKKIILLITLLSILLMRAQDSVSFPKDFKLDSKIRKNINTQVYEAQED